MLKEELLEGVAPNFDNSIDSASIDANKKNEIIDGDLAAKQDDEIGKINDEFINKSLGKLKELYKNEKKSWNEYAAIVSSKKFDNGDFVASIVENQGNINESFGNTYYSRNYIVITDGLGDVIKLFGDHEYYRYSSDWGKARGNHDDQTEAYKEILKATIVNPDNAGFKDFIVDVKSANDKVSNLRQTIFF